MICYFVKQICFLLFSELMPFFALSLGNVHKHPHVALHML